MGATIPGSAYRMVDFCVFVNCFGTSTGFLIVCSTLIPKVVLGFAPHASGLLTNRLFWVIVFATPVLPLMLLKNLDALKFTSFMAFVFICYVLAMMIVYASGAIDLGDDVVTGEVHYGFPGDFVKFA